MPESSDNAETIAMLFGEAERIVKASSIIPAPGVANFDDKKTSRLRFFEATDAIEVVT